MARGRKKGRFYPQIERRVNKVVDKYPGASTHEVSTKAKVSWSTAKKYLSESKKKGRIKSRKRGKKTIWY